MLSSMTWLEVIGVVATDVRLWWILSGLVLSWTKGRHDRKPLNYILWVWAELRPFYLPAVVVHLAEITLTGEMKGWNILFACTNILNWYLFKDAGDDERWKRRAKKAVEKIKQVGSKLVVVPSGT